MPDSEVDKPGTKPSPQPGEQSQAASASGPTVEDSIEDELDRLLAEIDIAVEELDPTGNLQEAAASARTAAVAGDPEYDEVEELFEVIVPEGAEADEDTDEAVNAEPDQPTDDADAKAPSADATQIDQELDALLAEAETLLESPAEDEPEAESEDPQAVTKTAEPDDLPEPEAVEAEVEPAADAEASTEAPTKAAAEAPPEARVETPSEAKSEVEAPAAPKPEKAAPKKAPSTPDHYKPDKRMVVTEAEPPKPKAADEKVSTKSIEALDADLADRAEKIVEEDTLPEAEDAFRSSEDVVEEVIDEHASAIDDAAQDEETDELAQLMAESPASSDLGLAGREAGEPAAKQKPETAATAQASATNAAPAVREKRDERRFAWLWIFTLKCRPIVLLFARILAKPLEFVPPRVRDDIGWLASVTLFLAAAVWVALMLFR